MRTSLTWTEPTIFPKNPKSNSDLKKDWRVWFRFFYDGKWKTISRKSAGIALKDIPNLKDRFLFAQKIQLKLKERLLKGWNPVTGTYPQKSDQEIEIENLQNMNFSEALDFAYNKKKKGWSHKTSQDYSYVVKYFKLAANGLDIFKCIRDFKKIDFKLILERAVESRNLSEKGYNKYKEFLSSLVGELVEWDILETNCIRDIKNKSVSKTIAHRPPTADQRILIVDRIKSKYRPYYRFLAILYGCTIRPKEITGIQIKHLHKIDSIFRLPKEIMKTRQARDVPIPGWVMDLLSEMNLHSCNPEWYIFSTRNKYGSFMPGPNRMHSNTSTTWWRKIVKEELGIPVNQYSLKKLSGNDMVLLQRREGVSNLLDLPRTMMGHNSNKMTEVYVDEHKKIIDKLIKEKMPEL